MRRPKSIIRFGSMIVAFAALAAWGCSHEEPVGDAVPAHLPKGARTLGIKVNLGEAGDFDAAFMEALAAGSETQVVPLDWNELETGIREYEPDVNYLAIADFYYPERNTSIHLAIRPVHTTVKVVPDDLQSLPLDDPAVIERFRLLLDWIAGQTPNSQIRSLVIGSEVDIYAFGDEKRWDEWIGFYSAVADHARRRFPDSLISSETTYAAFSGPDLERLRRLHGHSDVIGVSYYPMENALASARAPDSVHGDFSIVTGAIPGKPVIFYQIGYPSSEELGSSEAAQAEFVRHAFAAWDRNEDRIRVLNFQWMHETPSFGVQEYTAYYGYDTRAFRAFLGSLGLQSWDGTPKPAWQVLSVEARQRGFGVAD